MSEYIMRKTIFRDGTKITLPEGTSNVKIDWDPLHDDYVIMYLELVKV